MLHQPHIQVTWSARLTNYAIRFECKWTDIYIPALINVYIQEICFIDEDYKWCILFMFISSWLNLSPSKRITVSNSSKLNHHLTQIDNCIQVKLFDILASQNPIWSASLHSSNSVSNTGQLRQWSLQMTKQRWSWYFKEGKHVNRNKAYYLITKSRLHKHCQQQTDIPSLTFATVVPWTTV